MILTARAWLSWDEVSAYSVRQGTYWRAARIYLALFLGAIALHSLTMDRELVAERAQIGEGTKDWDRVLAYISMLLFMPGYREYAQVRYRLLPGNW